MGIVPIAVYSDADAGSRFVTEADFAYRLGGGLPSESYLAVDRIIEGARRTGADAVHPGYGFLAESPAFARAVIEAGLIWVGPPPEVIATLGSKLRAKEIADSAGVRSLPSVSSKDLAGEALQSEANRLGYPILIKAVAGGGGRGMRLIDDPSQLAAEVEGASSEAAAAFGDGSLFLEKGLTASRHVEIQVMADLHGNVVSLGERECSLQRRFQKLIEESPSPAIDDGLRAQMGEAAVAVARAARYVGAGTVEFLLAGKDFWFLEVNTRLQVEHGVTEETTGLDLVRLQLLVAAGQPLPEEALDPEPFGHAIEARLYAEDPLHGFVPSFGRFERFQVPEASGLRVDSAIEDGSEQSTFYDSMVAKLIAWAPSRAEAAALLVASLERTRIHGPATNRDLLVRLLRHPDFKAGRVDIGFLERQPIADLAAPLPDREEEQMAAVAAAICAQAGRAFGSRFPSGWRNNPSQPQRVSFAGAHGPTEVGYLFRPNGTVEIEVDRVPWEGPSLRGLTPDRVGLELDGLLRSYEVSRSGLVHHVDGPSGYSRLIEEPRFPDPTSIDAPGSLISPMPGRIARVLTEDGAEVEEGQVLVVIEAMKMEHSLRSPHAGVVSQVQISQGSQVEAGQTLVVVTRAGD
jgi:acetyl/propionyl-CoA carboxylase alpha subunit